VAIVIYTLSVVDIPLLLGPNVPGVLATVVYQQHYQWGADNQAVIGVWCLLLLSAVLFLLLHGLLASYPVLARLARSQWQKTGQWRWQLSFGKPLLQVGAVLSLLVLAALLLESFAGARFYPALWPQQWQANRWLTEWPYIWPLLLTSGWLALVSAGLATVAAIAVLERQRRIKNRTLHWFPLLMLFIPQLVLVLGWQKVAGAGSAGPLLIWSHVVFCFPYAYLVLHGAWVNVSDRWLYQAQSLGYSYRQAWWQVLLPMVKHAVFSAFAVAFSVSIAQYLPTLWLAGGTLPTITTEAVSIASGGDWRLASLYALMQALLPLGVFTVLLGRKPKQQAIDVTH
jgi:putative thiamine transport system permease protein